jgi:hypothetical protein
LTSCAPLAAAEQGDLAGLEALLTHDVEPTADGGGQITGISAIVNPDKLAHLGPLADYTSLLRSRR